jgi:hypothetical protein
MEKQQHLQKYLLIPAIDNNNDQAPATPRQFSIGISNLAGTLECDDPENDEKK